MNMLKEYIAYLKDNPEHYWFKRKLFGWGWSPATWEGVVVIVVAIVAIVGNSIRFDIANSGDDMLKPFIIQTAIIVAVLIAICYRTGEKPRWQWGFPKDDKKDEI
ncbi:MAG: hypothetical protein NUW00_05050 [Candidatus Kaiserbacteria bacterium]|nr:hypothetical protein [Candidatus Kaiserbacteria bacterium]